MTHLSIEQLLAVREPGLEPGVQLWRQHVDECETCQAELVRLDQRVARLKALPTLRATRDLFSSVRAANRAERRRRTVKRLAIGSIALAATVTIAVFATQQQDSVPDRQLIAVTPGADELEVTMARARQLENLIASMDVDRGVLDGRTVGITVTLQDRLAHVREQLQGVSQMESPRNQQEALRLWRERVGLLDALVDVHLTRARYLGF